MDIEGICRVTTGTRRTSLNDKSASVQSESKEFVHLLRQIPGVHFSQAPQTTFSEFVSSSVRSFFSDEVSIGIREYIHFAVFGSSAPWHAREI